MNSKRAARGLVAAGVLGASIFAAIPAPAAHADSGFCGVRDDDGMNNGDNFYYVVYNKCAETWSMRIVVSGHKLYCQNVRAHSYAAWSSLYFDPNWYIQVC
ncbi:MAG TPA: hypothetical protein VH637_08240 [Streptosporangiaceae bacterium]